MSKENHWGPGCGRAVTAWRPREAMYEAVKVKSGLLWIPQDVRHARAVGSLQRKLLMEWNQPKKKKCVTVTKAEKSWRSESILTSGVEVQCLNLSSWFSVLLWWGYGHCASFPMLWNGNVYHVLFYVGSMIKEKEKMNSMLAEENPKLLILLPLLYL